ncbi:hypothetical protein SeLEV6574_g03853 [Synchytrium endobioticum]|uniref:Phospholipid-transporting ATPase n=1 Tax=Synchytrium endobioticum TaxID=286115 RepID=A0A507D2D3_9FUNG|nr:hypothetical protein SeLEV6574_g03853 [Synchytrium endobioticum]
MLRHLSSVREALTPTHSRHASCASGTDTRPDVKTNGADGLPAPVSAKITPEELDPNKTDSDPQGPESKRRVYVNVNPQPPFAHVSHVGNQIRTSKYTLVTFIPKNVFEQLRSVANFYFISLVILQSFDPFKNVDFALTAAPILFILGVTALKDAFEDYKRHEADTRANNTRTYLLSNWKNVNPRPENAAFQFAALAFYLSSAISYVFQLLGKPIIRLIRPRMLQESKISNSGDFPPYITFGDYPRCAGDVAQATYDGVSQDSTSANPNADVASSADVSGSRVSNICKSSRGGTSQQLRDSSNAISSQSSQPKAEKMGTTATTDPVWKLSLWQDAKVGDWVFIRENDPIPADVVVVSTSEPDNVCYVETKNLDGETNLKIRRGITELAAVKTPAQCAQVKLVIDSELPSANLYTYSGVATVYPQATPASERGAGKVVPIAPVGILLRGCVLRNTGWIIGIVIYTGVETKVMLNSGETPSKRSKIQRTLNPIIVLNFVILVALCLINACAAAIYLGAYRNEGSLWNLGDSNSTLTQTILDFFIAMIIYQNIIPIALYVSVEVAKTIQSVFIYWDDDMYDSEADKHVVPHTYNLCDDLGQIEYIFSDKTGTLTANVMEFRMCSINGVVYGDGYITEAKIGAMQREGVTDFDKGEMLSKVAGDEKAMRNALVKDLKARYIDNKRLSFVDMNLIKDLQEEEEQARAIREFFILLACCHTLLVDTPKDSAEANTNSNTAKKLIYKAQSPDEAALVAAARDVGVAFVKRAQNSITVDVYSEERTYQVLNVLEFNSDRKRMSVILRDAEGRLVLLCKGADSVIYERLVRGTDQALADKTSADLEGFANDGLRTLCLAWRIIPDEVYQSWAETYLSAQAQITDREKAIDAAAELIEKDLVLLGATAIEDKLQDGVPDCIALLAQAGIKIWVLTGDKVETAINIGFACNLLTGTMVLIVVRATTAKATSDQLKSALNRFWDENGGAVEGEAHALIIDGESLKYALEADCREFLLELGCRCKAVVCARVSPLQKARVVQLVRKGLNVMTLAIGDGANDVSMIQEAEVGVGISGKEVHGKWAYVRTSGLIFNYFYKNIMWLFILFWYQFESGFSADVITDFTYGQFYNTLFTLLPNIYIGTFDQDVNDALSLKLPEIYQKGIRNDLFTNEQVWIYIADGIYQSVIVYWGVSFLFGVDTDPRGYSGNKDAMGTIMAWAAVLIANFYMAIGTYSWTWIAWIALIATLAMWGAYVTTYAFNVAGLAYGQIPTLYQQPAFYFVIVLIIIIAFLPRLLAATARIMLWPSDTDIVREMQKYDLTGLESTAAKEGRMKLNKDPGPPDTAVDDVGVEVVGNEQAVADESGIWAAKRNPVFGAVPPPEPAGAPAITIDDVAAIPLTTVNNSNTGATGATLNHAGSGQITPPRVVRDSVGNAGQSSNQGDQKPGSDAPKLAVDTTPATLNNGIPTLPAYHPQNDPQAHLRGRTRVSSNRRTSFHLATLPARLVGEFVRSVPRRMRAVSTTHQDALHTPQRSQGTIVYMENEHVGRIANTGFSFSHEAGMEGVVSPIRVSAGSRSRLRGLQDRAPQNSERLSLGDSLRKSLHMTPRNRNSSREPLNVGNTDVTGHPHGNTAGGETARPSNAGRERKFSGQKMPIRLPFLYNHHNQQQTPYMSETSLNQSYETHSHRGSIPPGSHSTGIGYGYPPMAPSNDNTSNPHQPPPPPPATTERTVQASSQLAVAPDIEPLTRSPAASNTGTEGQSASGVPALPLLGQSLTVSTPSSDGLKSFSPNDGRETTDPRP